MLAFVGTMAVLPFPNPAHPLCAADVMSTAVVHANPEDDVLEVTARMMEAGVRHVVIVVGDGRVVGMVSDRDIRTLVGDPVEALRRDEVWREPIPVERAMTPNPLSAWADTGLTALARRLVEERVEAMPVVDEQGRIVGVVSWIDLVHHAFIH